MKRLTWKGNLRAQNEADRAWAKLKSAQPKKRRNRKQKRADMRRHVSDHAHGSRGEYQEYLRSPEWRKIRRKAIKAAGYKCQVCGKSSKPLHVHHKTYKNLGFEQPDDLAVLCPGCHAEHHREAAKRRAMQSR